MGRGICLRVVPATDRTRAFSYTWAWSGPHLKSLKAYDMVGAAAMRRLCLATLVAKYDSGSADGIQCDGPSSAVTTLKVMKWPSSLLSRGPL
jgi:hypothetical protein